MTEPSHVDKTHKPEKTSQPHEEEFGSVPAFPRVDKTPLSPANVLHLQRVVGNQQVQRLIGSGDNTVQRQPTGVRDHRITIATILDDMIGHAWIILERPIGGGVYIRDTWGFYPTVFDMGAMLGPGDGVPGRVVHPDPHNDETPSTSYLGMTDAAGYQRAIAYAQRQRNRRYHLLTYNCAQFANEMYTMATGEISPNAGAVVQTPYGTGASTQVGNFVRYVRDLF